MKKQAFLIFLIGLTAIGHSQTIIYDIMMSKPDSKTYSDTINPIDKSFKKCDSTWVTNPEWSDCLLTHIDLWDKYMKKTYDTLMTVMDSTGQALLKQSQDYWEKSVRSEDDFSNYVMNTGGYSSYFGRDDDFKRFYSDLAEVKGRALELKSCLEAMRDEKKYKKDLSH